MSRLRPRSDVTYRILVGMDYLGSRREPGEVVSDIPPESVDWLKEQGCIEPVQEGEEVGDGVS